jgi:hypothetical protein
MKKLFLMATMFAATVCNAQVVLWDGEDKELGSDGGFWNRADPTVVEDNGNKCLKITLKANPNPEGWDQEHHNAALPIGDANFKGLRRVSFRIKMADKHNVMVQLEGKEGAYNLHRIFWYDTPNEWQTMEYEFGVGPDNDKVGDETNNVIAIWPYEETAEGEGKEVFIDDIQLEGAMVNDIAVRTLEDGSLTGNVVVTGFIKKGNYQNTWDGDWHSEDFDDYNVLASKLSANVTSIDLRGAQVYDGDAPQLRQKNTNTIIFATEAFYENDNVVVKGNATKLVLNDAFSFATPENFKATAVELTRSCQAGINSFVLPFWVSAEDLGATNVATYKEVSGKNVVFTLSDHADANVPFLTVGMTETTAVNFSKKGVVATPNSLGTKFIGVYAQQSAEGLWGITNAGKLQPGSSSATIKAFHAYLTNESAAREIAFDGGETTGISEALRLNEDIRNKKYFDLTGRSVVQPTKGLYIVNGKKVVIE